MKVVRYENGELTLENDGRMVRLVMDNAGLIVDGEANVAMSSMTKWKLTMSVYGNVLACGDIEVVK